MHKELNEVKEQMEQIREHSAQWEIIKFQGAQQAKRDTRSTVVIIILAVILAATFIFGGVFINKMSRDYRESVETLTQKYLDYLAQYDFSGTTEVTVDAANGTALYQDVGGVNGTALYQDGERNVLNNGESN